MDHYVYLSKKSRSRPDTSANDVNGAVTNFFWEGDNLAYELTQDYKPIRRYMYGPGMDDVEGHFEYSENTGYPLDPSKKGWYTYVKDQVGTVYQVFDETTPNKSSVNEIFIFMLHG